MRNLTPLKYFDSLYPPTTRKKEIQQFIPFIEKGLSSQVVGLPGAGKSNIFRLLSYNKEVRFENFGEYEEYLHFVYIDCSEVKGRPLVDLVKFMLLSLVFSLGERRMDDESNQINELLRQSLVLPDEMLFFQSLKKAIDILSIEKKLAVYFMFDKFDMILPDINSQFFTNLRILRNHAKYRFGGIFSMTRPLEESVDSSLLSDFYDLVAGNIIYPDLYDEVGITFRMSYIENAARKTLSEDQKKEIVRLSGGHAQLTKLSCEALISEDENVDNLESFLFKRPTVQGTLYSIWNALLPSEQLLLKNLPSFEDVKTQHPYLVLSGLVGQNGISIPLLASYIKTVPIVSSEKIIFNEEKNEIFVGESALSSKLSPTEFKLLKFMAQNKERLIQKDEIIENAWGDQKSYEGVTDQALDQVFYRLRKKIEKDPTNPHYIQTIKGKGYKLSD